MSILLRGLLIAALVALNAFFVGAEYALLSVRRTRIEQLAREGKPGARQVLTLLGDVGLLFSGIQLGITIASLLMGWLGEAIMAQAIQQVLERYIGEFASLAVAHSVASGIAFLLIITVLMVLGELVPKALSYAHAEQAAQLLAWPMLLFLRVSRYPIRVLDGLASIVLRALGQKPGNVQVARHTPEEVKLIVSGIRRRGWLKAEQEEMIHSVFDLHRVLVREIMVPRPRITCLPVNLDFKALLERLIEDQHSRIPIYDRSPDHIVGILYAKDLLPILFERLRQGTPLTQPFDFRSILHQPMIVPETMPLSQALEEARRKQSQMALVVDEFGTFVGLVTVEDVLEEIVGEIQDEYDREEKAIDKVGENVLLIDASLNLRQLADDYALDLPRGVGYQTLGGFVLAQLGFIPAGGESFMFEGRRYTVVAMEGRRVAKVRVDKVALPAPAPGGPVSLPKTPRD